MFISIPRLMIIVALLQEFASGRENKLYRNLRSSKKSKGKGLFYQSGTILNTVGMGSLVGTLVGLNHLADLTVSLCDISGKKIAVSTVDVSGTFEFTNLLADTYYIHVDIPSQYSTMVTTFFDSQVTILSNQVTTISLGPG
jgi:hypothetical protein